jgi:hypothetical protein
MEVVIFGQFIALDQQVDSLGLTGMPMNILNLLSRVAVLQMMWVMVLSICLLIHPSLGNKLFIIIEIVDNVGAVVHLGARVVIPVITVHVGGIIVGGHLF